MVKNRDVPHCDMGLYREHQVDFGLISEISCVFRNGLPQFLIFAAYVTSAFPIWPLMPARSAIILQDGEMQFKVLTHL